ncbi:MAG TPA: VOC family protein [Myxococcota bacterium]|nr:VOC family protein [Myxococcota bacterium]
MGIKTTKDSIDLGIISVNGPAMLAFYRDVLGLAHQGDMPMPTGGLMHRLACGTSVIKLVVPDKPPASRAAPGGIGGGTGYRYWTISVSNLDDVVSAAQSAGHKIVIPRRKVRAGVEIAMLEDPDGNWVELLEQS